MTTHVGSAGSPVGNTEDGHDGPESVIRSERPRHLYIVHCNKSAQPAHTMLVKDVPATTNSTTSRGMLDRTLQAKIGRMLRDVFSDVSAEPVPERFEKLLEALQAREEKS